MQIENLSIKTVARNVNSETVDILIKWMHERLIKVIEYQRYCVKMQGNRIIINSALCVIR